jgi:hypothetical protein
MNTQETISQKGMSWIKKHPILSIVGVIFVIGIVGSVVDPVEKKTITTEPEVVAVDEPKSLEDTLKSFSIDKGGATSIVYKSIEDQKADSNRPDGSRMITVSYTINSYYTADYLYKKVGEISSKVMQEVYKSNPNTYDVIIWYYSDIIDQYGNKENKVLISQAIDKATYEKINWQNFDTTKLCDFLKSEASSNGGETACVTLAKIK